MGAINYKTNNFVTVGYNIPKKEKEAEGIATEAGETFDTNALYYEEEEMQAEEIKDIINNYNFNFFDVKLTAGYYQGFYIDFDFDFLYFYNYQEKQETLKEATKLKKLLYELLQYDCVVCLPGWCTSYLNKTESKKEIKEAIKNLKEKIKNTLTEKRYFKKYDIFGNLKEV